MYPNLNPKTKVNVVDAQQQKENKTSREDWIKEVEKKNEAWDEMLSERKAEEEKSVQPETTKEIQLDRTKPKEIEVKVNPNHQKKIIQPLKLKKKKIKE
jgi:DNA-binding protein H-NS